MICDDPLFCYKPSRQNQFKGSYNGTLFAFTGLATDEIFLVRAECRARTGDINGAMDDLNRLLQQRWKTGTFVPSPHKQPNRPWTLYLLKGEKKCLAGVSAGRISGASTWKIRTLFQNEY